MSRLPFNPATMAAKTQPGADAASSRADPQAGAISVSELAALIDAVLRDHTPTPVRVVGEIGQFKDSTHWYFSIKDEESVIQCVMFRQSAARAEFVPQAGQRVVLAGTVEFYAPRGALSLIVSRIEPVGAGPLDLAFRRLCEELRALGWFAQERKRSLPQVPRRVAVITSAGGAALQDVIVTARRRCPGLVLALADVRVQGEGAADEIAWTVREVGRRHAEIGIDVILVTRGGGSMEDLWAFNERTVAEAIVNSPIPVVAAIGHETDTTIAELVADLRCATPTHAAMCIAPDCDALREQVGSLGKRLSILVHRSVLRPGQQTLVGESRRLAATMRASIERASSRLDRAAARLERHRPGALYARRETLLRHASSRLQAAMLARITRHDLHAQRSRLDAASGALLRRSAASLDAAARALDLVGPLNVLRRGYSVTFTSDGSILRSASSANPGETIQTRLADGNLSSVVVPTPNTPTVSSAQPTSDIPNSASRPPAKPCRRAPNQMDLF